MAADRAINMALRVLGIGEVERDFRRVGQAGEKSFAEVRKGANGAALEVSEYTARLKRATAEAKRLADTIPDLNKPNAQSRTNRNQFILGAVKGEQERIMSGAPDATRAFGAADAAAAGFGSRLGLLARLASGAGLSVGAMALAVKSSATAYMEHEQALDAFHARLSLSGNRSMATAAEIEAMAKRVVASTRQTEQAALQGAAALAQVPGLTVPAMEAALEATARYADAAGEDLPEAMKRTAAIMTALATEDMPGLLDATDGLDRGQRILIMTLAEAGKTAEAQEAYFAHLNRRIGSDSDGLTTATGKLNDAWTDLKISLGQDIAGPAAAALDWLAEKLRGVQGEIETTRFSWNQMFKDAAAFAWSPLGSFALRGDRPFGRVAAAPQSGPAADPRAALIGQLEGAFKRGTSRFDAQALAGFESRYGSGKARSGGSARRSGGGRSAAGGADREADRLAREAERARDAADKTIAANEDVIDSYRLRASEARARIGLEGAALEAVERQQQIEAAVRRLSTEAIEQEVEARRKEAAVKKQGFDLAGATAAATATVRAQQGELRRQAGELLDVEKALADFTRRQSEAKAIIESTRTPLEALSGEVGKLTAMFKAGDIGAETYNRGLDSLAAQLADARYEIDETAQAWEGFGQDVGRTLADFVLDGGSALDVLRQLVRLPLERVLEQTLVNPVADWVDGLTGNNRDKNTAAARADLDGLAGELMGLGAPAGLAATQIGGLGQSALAAQVALDSFTQRLAMASGLPGSAGGGAGLGGLLGLFGGGSPSAALHADVARTIAGNPALFASGTPSLPVGRDFYVGENGRERMRYHGGGRLEVVSGPRTHREAAAAGGVTIVQNVSVPERADPRRTASGIARSTQGAIARAHRKGLATTRR